MIENEKEQRNSSETILDSRNDNDVQTDTDSTEKKEEKPCLREELLNHIAKSKAIFKSQQKGDPDLTFEEKQTIAFNILQKSHCLFLFKFGHYLKKEHLKYFEEDKEKDYEVCYHINRLQRYFNNSKRQVDVKNRRYQALKALIDKGEYFSECEMMKRNPLLYEQLIGQYMTEEQKKERDATDTIVNYLMESIDRETLIEKQKLQEEEEQNVLEENDSDEESSEDSCTSDETSCKIPDSRSTSEQKSTTNHINKHSDNISIVEKQILKEEFLSNMYQSFLDGKDTDFDYSTVDDNEEYDNIDLRTQDEEERYFDSESPETVAQLENSEEVESEDELDTYMNTLKERIATNTTSMDNHT